jgi:hypothetical protein
MILRRIGCAELYGRLRHVVNRQGPQRRTLMHPAGWPTPFFGDDLDASCLHSHVLRDLGVTAERLDTVPPRLCGVEFAYPELGFLLTEKAERLAELSQELEKTCAWGEAVDTATWLAHDLDDGYADRRLGDAALLAILQHAASGHRATMTPRLNMLPQDTPLFIEGYPTTLLGYVAAELRVDAVTGSTLKENNAVELFRTLGWQLTPRAQALAATAQEHEANQQSWPDSVRAAETSALDHLAREDSDR